MKKRVFRILAVAFLWFCAALAASALEDIPVYGPARVAVEDSDLLANTVLEVGVLAVTPDQTYRVVIGDGITPGGIPIHPEGCVTQFNQIANATTNLNMHSYSITFGSWSMSSGLDEFGLTWGGSETWLRLVRDTGIAYLSYDFTIIDPAHYRFELVWTGEGYDFPVLMVSTNLLQGYAAADPDDVTYSRPDVSHLVVEYSVPGDYEFLGFRFFAPDRMKTGAYFGVPVHADYGLAAVGSLSVTGRVESYYDEIGEENRDRYVPGSITIDGEEVATTGAVAAVAADLATHAGDTGNPHGVTFAQVLEADEDGMRDDFGMSFSGGDGISALSGFGRTIEVETGTFLGDWHFDERPSVGTNGVATTNEVASAVSAHAGRTDNPHAVTAAQIGALTSEHDAAALAALNTASNALRGAIAAHTGNTANPHGVTAAQTGALPAAVDDDAEDEAYVVEHPTRFSWPLSAPWVEIAADAEAEEGEYAVPYIDSPFSSLANSVLALYRSRNRSFGLGLALHSPYTFMRMSMGERARLVFSREGPRGAEKALLEADDVTIKSGVYDEEEDEWVPGQILLDGNATVYGDTLLDGNAHVEGGLSVVEDADFGGAVSAQSLTIGTGTTTNLSELATAASVSVVSDRVGDIEDDYLTSEDAAGFATTGAVASVEGRVGEVEARLDEYWCKWTSASLSETETNWIPTNWPARTVWCFVTIFSSNNVANIAMPKWYPAENCTLHLLVIKPTNCAGYYFRSADGNSISSTTSTSGVCRDIVVAWRSEIQQWIVTVCSLSQATYYIRGSSRGTTAYSALPEDSTFAPVIVLTAAEIAHNASIDAVRFGIVSEAPSAAMLSASSPRTLSSSAPLALDAAPASLEDLAPDDFTDDDPTDPYAVPDAIDHQEASSNLEFEDFAAFDDPEDEYEATPEPEESR